MNNTSSLHRLSLLKWPTELRLAIYNQLIVSCLREGAASDISGLYLCCRTVHQEVKAEYMRTLEPLLLAKHRWETSSCSHLGFLSIESSTDLHLDPHDTKIHVTMPLDTAGAAAEDFGVATSYSSLECLAFALKSVLTSPWSQMILRFDGQMEGVARPDLLPWTFRDLVRKFDTCVFDHPRMQRLTFWFGEDMSGNSRYVLLMFETLHVIQQWEGFSRKRKPGFERAYLFSIGTVPHLEWGFSIDFGSGPEPVEGVAMTLKEDDKGKIRFC